MEFATWVHEIMQQIKPIYTSISNRCHIKVHAHNIYITVIFNNGISLAIKNLHVNPYMIYQSMVLLYINKDSRESLKITKSTVGHDTVPFNPYH